MLQAGLKLVILADSSARLQTKALRKPAAKKAKLAGEQDSRTCGTTAGELGSWSAAMETELEDLTGQFDQLKRESLRPSVTDNRLTDAPVLGKSLDSTRPLPQSATRQILQPIRNPPTIAARLQALKKGAVGTKNESQNQTLQAIMRLLSEVYLFSSQSLLSKVLEISYLRNAMHP